MLFRSTSAATTALPSPNGSALPSDKPTPAAAALTEMPEIRLPVAAPFSAASAAIAASGVSPPAAAAGVALGLAATAAATAAVTTVAAAPAVPRAEPTVAKIEPKVAAASKPPKGVKISKTAWANGPRGVCSARTGAASTSCLKTQCRTRKWASHPQCNRAVAAKSTG